MLSFHSKLFKISHCIVLEPVPNADVRDYGRSHFLQRTLLDLKCDSVAFMISFWQRLYLLSARNLLRYKGEINSDYFTEILFT